LQLKNGHANASGNPTSAEGENYASQHTEIQTAARQKSWKEVQVSTHYSHCCHQQRTRSVSRSRCANVLAINCGRIWGKIIALAIDTYVASTVAYTFVVSLKLCKSITFY
jgi:hypothetical protein